MGITIQVGPADPVSPGRYVGGTIQSTLLELVQGGDADATVRAVIDGLESFILACACEGVDVEAAAFQRALQTAVEAIANDM
jgi:hypothetical protein